MEGLKGLSYLKYQEDKIKQFLHNKPGMKMLIHVDALSKYGETFTFRTRGYEVLDTDDVTETLSKMAQDIELQIESAPLHRSNIVIEKISKLTNNYDKYNPTRAGSYVELPKWLSLRTTCINTKSDDSKCFV